MSDDASIFPLFFANHGLPNGFFKDGERLYERISKGSYDEEVTRLWKTTAEEFKYSGNEKLTCRFYSLDRDKEVMVITLPDPIQPTGAKHLGLVYSIHHKLFKSTVKPERYFILQLGKSNLISKYYLGERDCKNEHSNHGEVSDNTIETFIKAIRLIMITGKLRQDFAFRNQEKQKLQPSNSSSDQLIEKFKAEQSELSEITQRWIDQVPKEAIKRVVEYADPIHLGLTQISTVLQINNVTPKQKLTDLIKQLKEETVIFGTRSMLIGYDCGNSRTCLYDEIKSSEDIPEVAMHYLRIAVEPLVFTASLLLKEYIAQ